MAWNRYGTLDGQADIVYQYRPTDQVSWSKYPEVQITTDYWYNKRGWLDSLESQYTNVTPKIFQQKLEYDSVGRIIKQKSKNASQAGVLEQSYGYDNVDRLQKWYRLGLGDTVLYEYDKVGNRTLAARIDGADVRTYQYGTPITGPNRLYREFITQPLVPTRRDYGYNQNGSVTDRLLSTPMPVPTLLEEEHFGYSYRELNWRYVSGNPLMDNHSDWRYRYNAMGEREQKRLYHAPLADSIAGQPYPWVYYLLGGSKDQLAVWHGQQITSPFCDTVRRRNVFLYPTEYITNGIGWNGVHEDITPIITKPDGSKEYRISDHLASLRVSLTNGSALKGYDYDPWGSLLGGATAPRRGFNDNEKDKENGVFSLGVRKYEEGRFLSLDPLFEKEPEISPYVYAGNAPLNYVDPEGLQRGAVFDGFDPLDFYDNNMLDGGGPSGVASRGSGMGVREFVSKVWQRVVGSGAISPAHRGAQASARASAQAHVNMKRNSSAQAAKSSGGGMVGILDREGGMVVAPQIILQLQHQLEKMEAQ